MRAIGDRDLAVVVEAVGGQRFKPVACCLPLGAATPIPAG